MDIYITRKQIDWVPAGSEFTWMKDGFGNWFYGHASKKGPDFKEMNLPAALVENNPEWFKKKEPEFINQEYNGNVQPGTHQFRFEDLQERKKWEQSWQHKQNVTQEEAIKQYTEFHEEMQQQILITTQEESYIDKTLSQHPHCKRPHPGVIPEYIWRERRVSDLLVAITYAEPKNYATTCKLWIEELAQHKLWLEERELKKVTK